TVGGNKDDGQRGIVALYAAQHFHPVYLRHLPVGDDRVVRAIRKERHRPLAVAGEVTFVASQSQCGGDHFAHPLLVVDDQNACVHGGAARGSIPLTRAPPDELSASRIDPPCASVICRAIASPSPPPLARVVKNGSKIRSRRAAGTPGPESSTASSTVE